MMLNGRLTHEASRVGKLEPIYALVAGPKADPAKAVRFAYREILTREPSARSSPTGANRGRGRDARSTAWPTCAGCS